MEINKPDQGVFKGMGALQSNLPNSKKYFPRIRNIHQFQYTHMHPNEYATAFQKFFTPNKTVVQPDKAKRHSNQSSFQLGTDNNSYFNPLSKTDYRSFEKSVPPKPIRPKEEGVVLGTQGKDQHFVTTMMDKFGKLEEPNRRKVAFKNRGLNRFNPITGEKHTLNFAFEDFQMGRKNNYKATNFTQIPNHNQAFDIISGRKLTYK